MAEFASSSIGISAEDRQAGPGRVELAAILSLALFARAIYWAKRPPDLGIYLEPWLNHIVHYGPIGAFAHPFSNYEPAYLYLLAIGSLAHGIFAPITIIKLISVAGTIFLTCALADLLRAAGTSRRAALFVLVLPSVAINDTLLAQCDALWAGSCIFGLAAMTRGQTVRALVWCGVAISFKAQAAFIAPVIIGAMIGRRAPLWQWTIPPLVFFASLLPAWLAGWPMLKLLTVYLEQAKLDQIPGQLANPWMLGTILSEQSSTQWFWLGYAAAIGAALTIAALAARAWREPRLLVLLGAMAGTALPFLLPKMLERYYFLGDVLTLALYLSLRERQSLMAVRGVQAASILSHLTYLYFIDRPYPALIGAVCAGAGLVAMSRLAAPQIRELFRSLPAPGRGPSSSGYSASATYRCSPDAAPSAAE
jgi:Gpi18-like mannosyltransferase